VISPILEFPVFFTSFSPQYIFGGVTNTVLNVVTNCLRTVQNPLENEKNFSRRIMIRISARCTTNMRRQVDNVHRRSRHLADGGTYRQSSEFPSVIMKLQISGPLQ